MIRGYKLEKKARFLEYVIYTCTSYKVTKIIKPDVGKQILY